MLYAMLINFTRCSNRTQLLCIYTLKVELGKFFYFGLFVNSKIVKLIF